VSRRASSTCDEQTAVLPSTTETPHHAAMTDDALIPPIGAIPQAERMFRINWVASLERSPSGVPLQAPEFVARQGRGVRIVDIREQDELLGPLGYIPGADWIPRDRAPTLVERVGSDAPVIIVSRGGERGSEVAFALEKSGMRMCASLRGGMVAWKALGFGTVRDPSILALRDRLRDRSSPPASGGILERSQIAAHVEDALSTRWIKAAAILLHGKRSCVDGRDDTGVIGTPGGDGGEIVLALAALEGHLGRALSVDEVRVLLMRAVDAFGNVYMHTDVHASNELIKSMRADPRLTEAIGTTYEAMEWRKWLSSPPDHVHDIVLEHMVQTAHVGCGHVRLMLQHPDDYGVRAELVRELIRAYLRLRWQGASQLEFVPLPGGHQEGAVVNVRVEGDVHSYTQIPLVSPSCAGTQMFVNHPQVSAYFRGETAALLCDQGDVIPLGRADEGALSARIEELAAHQMGLTLGHLAKGLPVFDVLYRRDAEAEITHAGAVPE
jgi:rhodanese-related sulfurtransferase